MTKIISVETEWKITNRMSRSAMETTEAQTSAVCGGSVALKSWEILGEIRAEIQPKIAEIRERQEILEGIGSRVNGGF